MLVARADVIFYLLFSRDQTCRLSRLQLFIAKRQTRPVQAHKKRAKIGTHFAHGLKITVATSHSRDPIGVLALGILNVASPSVTEDEHIGYLAVL